MKVVAILAALLCVGCAEPVVRAGGKCGVIYPSGVSAWVPCAEVRK